MTGWADLQTVSRPDTRYLPLRGLPITKTWCTGDQVTVGNLCLMQSVLPHVDRGQPNQADLVSWLNFIFAFLEAIRLCKRLS